MKKLFVLFCTVTMCLSLVACGNKSELEKYKKYETLIYYMEAEDYKAAYEELIRISRADGNTENAKENANEDKKEKIVEITMDNWQEYFEKRDVYRVEYNEFDEIEEIYFYGILALKDGIEIDSAVLNAENGWYHSFEGLYKFEDGKEIDVTISASDLCDILKEQFTGDFTYSGVTGENIAWQDNGYVDKAAIKYVLKEAN